MQPRRNVPVRSQSLGLADTAGGVFVLKGGGVPPPRFRPPPPPGGEDKRAWGRAGGGGRLAEYVETSSEGEDSRDPPPLDYRYNLRVLIIPIERQSPVVFFKI